MKVTRKRLIRHLPLGHMTPSLTREGLVRDRPSPYLPTANIIETHHITRRTPGQNLGVLLSLFFCILVIKAVCFHLIKIAGQNPRALQR